MQTKIWMWTPLRQDRIVCSLLLLFWVIFSSHKTVVWAAIDEASLKQFKPQIRHFTVLWNQYKILVECRRRILAATVTESTAFWNQEHLKILSQKRVWTKLLNWHLMENILVQLGSATKYWTHILINEKTQAIFFSIVPGTYQLQVTLRKPYAKTKWDFLTTFHWYGKS